MEHISMHLPKPSEGGSFSLVPAGTYPAVCYRIVDLGTQPSTFQGETKLKHKVMVSWELHDPDTTMEDGKPMSMHQSYTWSMHENATLRKHLEAWRGKAYSDSELGEGGFNIKKLLGVGCYMGVVHNDSNGSTFANISAISKLPKGMDTPAPVNPLTYFWIKKDTFDAGVLALLSEKIQTKIKDSPEYKRLMSGAPEPDNFHGDPIPF
jgi:hypothetical protein